MKKIALIFMIVLSFCAITLAANEVIFFSMPGQQRSFSILRPSDVYMWDRVAANFIPTVTDANRAINLTESSNKGIYYGTFPATILAGAYKVICNDTNAALLNSNYPALAERSFSWNGSAEQTFYDVNNGRVDVGYINGGSTAYPSTATLYLKKLDIENADGPALYVSGGGAFEPTILISKPDSGSVGPTILITNDACNGVGISASDSIRLYSKYGRTFYAYSASTTTADATVMLENLSGGGITSGWRAEDISGLGTLFATAKEQRDVCDVATQTVIAELVEDVNKAEGKVDILQEDFETTAEQINDMWQTNSGGFSP